RVDRQERTGSSSRTHRQTDWSWKTFNWTRICSSFFFSDYSRNQRQQQPCPLRDFSKSSYNILGNIIFQSIPLFVFLPKLLSEQLSSLTASIDFLLLLQKLCSHLFHFVLNHV